MNLLNWIVPGIAAIVLIISIIAKKMEWFLNFATRLCVGALALYVTNEIITRAAFQGQIGVNSITLSTVALLGIPGFLLVVCVELIGGLKK